MTSRHSLFTIGASPGAPNADRFAGCGADAGDSCSEPALSRIVHLGRAAVRGIHTALPLPTSLERAFSDLLHEVRPGRGVRLRIFIDGKQQALRPAIQEQLFLIAEEAVVNALRHSKATKIEVEVQYLRRAVRLFVRDNGCGIDPDVVQKESDSYRGMREMRDRAGAIGAQFGIWSRLGAGTEVRVCRSF